MRQKRSLELMTDLETNLHYHSSKVNINLDALSRRPMTIFHTQQKELFEEIRRLDLEVIFLGPELQLMTLQLQLLLIKRIKEYQKYDPKLQKLRSEDESKCRSDLNIHADGLLQFENRLFMPMKMFEKKFL